jgi:hypothetical protein
VNKLDLLLDVIERLPGSKVRPLAVALHYMSEDVAKTGDWVVGYLKMLEFVIENGLRLVEEEAYVLDVLTEDGAGGVAAAGAPANSVAGVQPTDQPVIDPKKKKRKYADIFARSVPA